MSDAFTRAELSAAKRLVLLALDEDIGPTGDVTSALLPPDLPGRAAFVARTAGVLAGLPVVPLIFEVDPALQLVPRKEDGDTLQPGDVIAEASGPMCMLLTAERTALNFLQRLSGVATLTRRYVDVVADLPCQVLDTRKTTPGWRLLEKYAVRQGGGHNHRMGLYDGVLVKDNHLAALAPDALGRGKPEATAAAVRLARARYGATLPLEVEVDTFEQFEAALAAGPDIILLDNMPPELLRRCVERRNAAASSALLEASGGVTLATLRAIAETGVDRVSIGALTHSAPALDIGLDYLT
jgi:nicotinate-nucleotide pyrophosphorylase (carboxylating)